MPLIDTDDEGIVGSTGMEDEGVGFEGGVTGTEELMVCEIPLPVGTMVWLQ